MFVHLVLIELKAGIGRDDPRVPAWEAKFAAFEFKCQGIVRFESGWNVTARPIAYDYGINMAFGTRGDLEAYGPNADHQEVVSLLRELADWVVCDYESPH